MKNYYALIRFNGNFVHGFLAIGYEDSESARLSIIKNLTEEINSVKESYKEDKFGYGKQKIGRLKSFRRSLTKPHRKAPSRFGKEPEPVLEMVELPSNFVIGAGYWLSHKSEEFTGHICNLAKSREEHPKGYVISQLK